MTRSLIPCCLAISLTSGCVVNECSQPAYWLPECRVQAENEFARLVSADGVELRFQSPTTTRFGSWEARGVLVERGDGVVEARVSTLGDFLITVHPGPHLVDDLTVEIHNVHPLTETLDNEIGRDGLQRTVSVEVVDEVVEIRGSMPPEVCSSGFELAAVGDIQTNPVQFQRIIQDLHIEAAAAAEAGTPLLGLLLLGDLSETSEPEELDVVLDMLRSAPVPTAAVPGNHDVYAANDAVFTRRFGAGNMAFDVCDAHVVMLDTGSGRLANSIVGRFPEFLDTDQKFTVAGMHHPPLPGRSSSGWTAEDQAQHLVAELAARDADMVLAGHAHRRFEFTDTPVHEVVVGTGGATQYAAQPDYGYLQMVFGDRLKTCFIEVSAPGPEAEVSPSHAPRTCR